ncbi:MAG: hypothetical protein NTNFB01_34520 [Nitrospira sp.]
MTTESGQHEVEQNERWSAALNVPPPAMAIGGQPRMKSGMAKCAIEQFGVKRFVFNDVHGWNGHTV